MVKRMKLGDVGTVAMGSLGIRRSGKWSVESQHLRGLHILIPNRRPRREIPVKRRSTGGFPGTTEMYIKNQLQGTL